MVDLEELKPIALQEKKRQFDHHHHHHHHHRDSETYRDAIYGRKLPRLRHHKRFDRYIEEIHVLQGIQVIYRIRKTYDRPYATLPATNKSSCFKERSNNRLPSIRLRSKDPSTFDSLCTNCVTEAREVVSTDLRQFARLKKELGSESVQVLQAWVGKNLEDPNPSIRDRHKLSILTGLSTEKITNWFHSYCAVKEAEKMTIHCPVLKSINTI